MLDMTNTRRFGFAGALGLAMLLSAGSASFAQSSGSISGGGDDAQSNSATTVAPGTAPMVESGAMDTKSTNSISGNGDDAQSNSLGSQSTGMAAGTASTQDCTTTQTASGVATTCNQQSGDDAESASGLPASN